MTQRLDVSLVQDLPPFLDMTEEALNDTILLAQSKMVKKGDSIFRQGSLSKEFYLLLDGHIRVVKLNSEGEQFVPRYISPGELFGIACAIGLTHFPASAIAARDCVILAWPNSIWDDLIHKSPSFATNTYHLIGKRLIETTEQLTELATAKVEKRVASAILKLADQTGKQTNDGILIDFPVSRQDISEMTGTTLHTVSRLLSSWESEGWVKSGRQMITLVDGRGISHIANNPLK